jgi:hypothetical protein
LMVYHVLFQLFIAYLLSVVLSIKISVLQPVVLSLSSKWKPEYSFVKSQPNITREV